MLIFSVFSTDSFKFLMPPTEYISLKGVEDFPLAVCAGRGTTITLFSSGMNFITLASARLPSWFILANRKLKLLSVLTTELSSVFSLVKSIFFISWYATNPNTAINTSSVVKYTRAMGACDFFFFFALAISTFSF